MPLLSNVTQSNFPEGGTNSKTTELFKMSSRQFPSDPSFVLKMPQSKSLLTI